MYRTCPDCGANLDPGEVCDCRKEKAVTGGNDTGDGTGKISTTRITDYGGKVNGEIPETDAC